MFMCVAVISIVVNSTLGLNYTDKNLASCIPSLLLEHDQHNTLRFLKQLKKCVIY